MMLVFVSFALFCFRSTVYSLFFARSQVFSESGFLEKIKRMKHDGALLSDAVFLADPAFPLSEHILKEFRNPTQLEVYYNIAISRARMKVEQTFGLLKARYELHRFACLSSNVFFLFFFFFFFL